ncbi:MAG: RNA 2',3'-cyclic phosphodiesterase [Acidobacteria bacterium]|nr:RNA 2',3'-cyclic phosphodiesterase [Acidobacteriota bacterium]
MRLFAAIELPGPARGALAALQKRVASSCARGAGSRLRWTRPDQMHITLAFIGQADEARTGAIVHACAPALPVDPFVLAFAGLGVYPARGAPRVLWVGVGDGAGEVVFLQRSVAARLAAAGIALEERRYHPHVTLGRWKASHGADARRVAESSLSGDAIEVVVDGVVLFDSRPSAGGRVYEPVLRTPLAGMRRDPLVSCG